MSNGMFLELRPLWEAGVAWPWACSLGWARACPRRGRREQSLGQGARTFALIALLGYMPPRSSDKTVPALPLWTLAGLSLLLSALHLEKTRRIRPVEDASAAKCQPAIAAGKMSRPRSPRW